MKITKFFFFLIFGFLTTSVMAQHIHCGTQPPTESQRLDIIRKLQLSNAYRNGCTDALDNSIKTYKLILEYAVKSDGTQVPTPSARDLITQYINSKFNPLEIYFEYYFFPVMCDNCDEPDASGWGRTIPTQNSTDFQGCLWGRLSQDGQPGISGSADFTLGRFWAKLHNRTIAHELGHALGLLHTFNAFKPNSSSLNELIFQDNEDCNCNCNITGDFICDTPADPYLPGDQSWNQSMFNIQNGIVNSNNITDFCGTLYSNATLDYIKVMSNIMSYHNAVVGTTSYIFTPGQGAYIKTGNVGKPWEISGFSSGGGSMQPGFVVNQPMTIHTPMNVTGDIIVNSKLTVSNTSIGFMNDHHIIINPGGELILDNGHLGLFEGIACIPKAERWGGIRANGPGTIKFTAKNGSSVNDAAIGLECTNATLIASVLSDSRINCYFTEALKISGGAGRVQVYGSIVNGTVSVTDFYAGIDFNASRVSIPNPPGFGQGQQGYVTFTNAAINVRNNSTFNALVIIANDGTQNINLRDSKFLQRVGINKANGKTTIRDNVFQSDQECLLVNNAKSPDMYNNTFAGINGLNLDGYYTSAPLVFKNQFVNGSFSIRNSQDDSGARLECNTMIGQGTRDWHFLEPVDRYQGNNELAAGNSFSRGMLEVNYLGSEKINYHYFDQGTEEPVNINQGAKFEKNKVTAPNAVSACSLPYPNTPSVPQHCSNGIQDGDETGIDCGGSCKQCLDITVVQMPSDCYNGIQDPGETGIDCGDTCGPCLATCFNGIQDNGEYGIDCGGPCPPCMSGIPPTCTDGVMNGNETGVDCGGPSCPPCDTQYCHDGIQNHGETGMDCGGPCMPCGAAPCNNGIQDGDETGVDCGGACPPCAIVYPPHCYNGIKDGNETDIDCGGACPPCGIVYPPQCYNGIKDGNETGIDCGGACRPCGYTYDVTTGTPGIYVTGDHTLFIQRLNEIYGQGYFTNNRYQTALDFDAHHATLDGGNSCAVQQFIINNSPNQALQVVNYLTQLSPNVSANTIHILFKYSQYFTAAQMSTILALNPAVLSDRYIAYIVYKTPTFSTQERALILQAAIPTENRTYTETMLSFKKQYHDAIARDNIAMLSLNTPVDFNAIRTEMATDPDPNRIFDIARTYIDQGRADLAVETLTQADLCRITDPIYRNQLDGLIDLYSNWNNTPSSGNGYRTPFVHPYLTQEHGLATDIAAVRTGQPISITKRWQYEPLIFLTPSATNEAPLITFDVFPNPAYDLLNVVTRGTGTYNIVIINTDGKILYEALISEGQSTIDISTLITGVYTLKVFDKAQCTFVTRFIKIK